MHVSEVINVLGCELLQGQDGSPPAWPADRLLMLNDVYFCHQGLIRLLQHSSAAIACGIDFFIDAPGGIVLYDSWVMRDAVSLRAVQSCPCQLAVLRLCFAGAVPAFSEHCT